MTTYIYTILYSMILKKTTLPACLLKLTWKVWKKKENEIELYLNEQQTEADEEQIG